MGVYFHVHVGPALVCKYHIEEKVTTETNTVTKTACVNPNCKNKQALKAEVKFCPQCGQATFTGTQTFTKDKRKVTKSPEGDIYDLMAEGGFREDVFQDCWGGLNCEKLIEDHDVLWPTPQNPYLDRETTFETRDFAILARNIDQKAECAKCEEVFAKEIAYLRTKYDSVTVEWMVLTTGS